MSSSPDLIVPIRDRRQSRRILTLRNFRKALLGVAVLFLVLTIQFDLRHSNSDHYGRLFGSQVSSQTTIAAKKFDVVREAPVPDQTAVDPLLLSAAVREQYLGVDAPLQPVTTTGAVTAQPLDAPHGDVAIVSGPNGVTIVKGEAPKRPTLSGGVFRQ
jgi:hypothetical protein